MLARLNTNAETQNLRWDSNFWVTRSPGQESRNMQGATGSLLYPYLLYLAALLFCLSALCKLLEETLIRGFSKQTKPALDKNHTGNLCIKVQTEDNRGRNYLKASQGPSLFAPVC